MYNNRFKKNTNTKQTKKTNTKKTNNKKINKKNNFLKVQNFFLLDAPRTQILP